MDFSLIEFLIWTDGKRKSRAEARLYVKKHSQDSSQKARWRSVLLRHQTSA